MRWPMSLISLGIVLFLLGLAGWWAQDAIAPFVNEGEAKMGQTLTFQASAGRYRVVTSGPTRPEAERTACDIELADESTHRLLAGEGRGFAQDHFGVSRVVEFEAKSGTTRVTCEDRYSPSFSGGRFQIVSTGGAVSTAINAAIIGGLGVLLVGIGWTVVRMRRGLGT